MFNSDILDVVIGLTFVYSLLSLVSTAINEMLETRVKMRSSDLERGIREMLNCPKTGNESKWWRRLIGFLPKQAEGDDLVDKLYNHPLINNLFEGAYPDARQKKRLPSYIPSRNFALALMDIMQPATRSGPGSDSKNSGATGATYKSANDVVLPTSSLREAISAFPLPNDNKAKQALMVLVDAAGNDIVQARKNIEDWFDSSMDRVSGWYKRRTQIITLLLGILIAAVINVDTLSIANSLYTTASMRDSLVAAAQEYAVVNPAPAENSGQTQGSSPEERISQNLEELRNLNIPIGWNSEDPHSIPTTSGGWVTKVLGCIITGFAISLGAPFWFDLLNKFVVIRSTVRPKEKSPEEPPVNK